MPILPELGRRRQEFQKFEASLGYIGSSRPTWADSQTLSKKKKS
jgi:hypothetical protein